MGWSERQEGQDGCRLSTKGDSGTACGGCAAPGGARGLFNRSVERDAQPEVDYVLLPAGRERPPTPRHAELTDPAVDEVGHRRSDDVPAHPARRPRPPP